MQPSTQSIHSNHLVCFAQIPSVLSPHTNSQPCRPATRSPFRPALAQTPRRRHRIILPFQTPTACINQPAQHANNSLTAPQDSYLQCVQCSALYLVEPEELEGSPRIVSCSACLHEWYASEDDLIWGEEEALAALEQPSGRGITRRDSKEAHARKAVVATQGVPAADVRQEEEAVLSDDEEGFVAAEDLDKEPDAKTDEEDQDQPDSAKIPNDEKESELQQMEMADADVLNSRAVEDAGTKSRNINVFVGNLSFRATEEDLYRAFSGYGAVLKCQIPADPSGASRGYGFVEMRSRESGLRAIECLQGTSILGRDVSLNEARPRRDNGVTYRRSSRNQWSAKDGRKKNFGSEDRGSFTIRKEQQKESFQDRWKRRS